MKLIILLILQSYLNYNFYSPNISLNTEQSELGIYQSTTIRKVKAYSEYDSINTIGRAGNPNPIWESGYKYYYNDYWYRIDENGNISSWRSLFNLGIMFYDWRSGYILPDNSVQYYKEKPVPLNDCIWIYILLCILYLLYINHKGIKFKISNYKKT